MNANRISRLIIRYHGAALENVPEDMRGMVRAHVEATFEKLKYRDK